MSRGWAGGIQVYLSVKESQDKTDVPCGCWTQPRARTWVCWSAGGWCWEGGREGGEEGGGRLWHAWTRTQSRSSTHPHSPCMTKSHQPHHEDEQGAEWLISDWLHQCGWSMRSWVEVGGRFTKGTRSLSHHPSARQAVPNESTCGQASMHHTAGWSTGWLVPVRHGVGTGGVCVIQDWQGPWELVPTGEDQQTRQWLKITRLKATRLWAVTSVVKGGSAPGDRMENRAGGTTADDHSEKRWDNKLFCRLLPDFTRIETLGKQNIKK